MRTKFARSHVPVSHNRQAETIERAANVEKEARCKSEFTGTYKKKDKERKRTRKWWKTKRKKCM